ncbi:MAG TPA: glycine--tRNA ligase subunit beta [bacterium]|nr:glycine--tRNA ligase subunit beta [bacterium]
MSKNLLFEIGAEEIPASYIGPALEQMRAAALAFFEEHRLTHGALRCEGTPRRLALMVADLQERQEDRSEEVIGPPVKAAYGPDGQPTQVAAGFAKGRGVEVADLVVKTTPKGDYVFAHVQQAGRYTVELLEAWLPQLPQKLAFPKSMRWGEGGPLRFARPISWLCALYGTRTLKFGVEHLRSGAFTQGHRFLAPSPIQLKDALEYEKKLARAHVVLGLKPRREELLAQLEKAAKKFGRLVRDEELLDVVANLLEKPFAFAGEFDPAYLVLPKSVIVKVLREHQFAFAVEREDGSLAPVFLATTNGIERNLAAIREGNARVVRARLEDAKFFYTEDQKSSLEQRREDLEAVVWHEKLGSVYERVERLESLAGWIAERLAPEAKADASRAARLCKSDLVTLMVGEKEFTSLQGEMGGVYARLGGENPAVSQAIAEHYRPRFAGDEPPLSPAGRCVALADKMDELVGSFGIGLIPSGSQDPYALRRKASGVVTLLKVNALGTPLSLSDLAEAAIHLYPAGRFSAPAAEHRTQLMDFFRARLENALSEAGYESSLVSAVSSSRSEWVAEAFLRAEALRRVMDTDGFPLAVQAFSRVTNILDKAGETRPVREDLLAEGPEKTLWERYLAARPVIERHCGQGAYVQAFEAMAALRNPIDAFFNDVLVMAEDPSVRVNRLSLLAQMARTIGLIADFRKLVKR